MSNEKLDRRVKYTKMVLRQALLEIMRQKNIAKITVKEICQIADVNRGTFYAHYASAEDLLLRIEEELFEQVACVLREPGEERGKPWMRSISFEKLYKLTRCIKDNEDLCRVLLGENGDREFLEKVIAFAYEECASEWGKSLNQGGEAKAKLLYAFIAEGAVGVLRRWVTGELVESSEDVAGFIEQFTYHGLLSFFQPDVQMETMAPSCQKRDETSAL